MTDTTFTPGPRLIAECRHAGRRLIEAFDLKPSTEPNSVNQAAVTMPSALVVFEGMDDGCIDGYDFMSEHMALVGRAPDPNYGEWPYDIEWFWAYDPKNNPPEGDDTMERLFLGVRFRRIEGELYLGFYLTVADAKTDSGRRD